MCQLFLELNTGAEENLKKAKMCTARRKSKYSITLQSRMEAVLVHTLLQMLNDLSHRRRRYLKIQL